VPLAERHAGAGRRDAVRDHDDRLHARGTGPRQHDAAVGIERGVSEMTVRIYEMHEGRYGLTGVCVRDIVAGVPPAAACPAATRARTPRASLPGHRCSMASRTGLAM
jgi:hypothetical protein